MYPSPSTFVLVQLGPDGKPVKKIPKADLDPQRRARQDRSNARAKKYYAKQQAVRAAAQKSERHTKKASSTSKDASVSRHSTIGAESSRDGATWSAERQDYRDQSVTTIMNTTPPPASPSPLPESPKRHIVGANTPDDRNNIAHRIPEDPYRPPRLRKYNTRSLQPALPS